MRKTSVKQIPVDAYNVAVVLQCCYCFIMLLWFYNVTMVLQCCYGFIMLLSFHPYCKVQLCKNMGNYFLGVMGVVTFGELKECLDTRHFL